MDITGHIGCTFINMQDIRFYEKNAFMAILLSNETIKFIDALWCFNGLK